MVEIQAMKGVRAEEVGALAREYLTHDSLEQNEHLLPAVGIFLRYEAAL